MHLFHYAKVDFLGREGQCLLIQSDEVLTDRAWVEGWVADETIHVRIQVVERLPKEMWGPQWLKRVVRLRERLRRPQRAHLYRVTIRKPVTYVPLLEILLDELPRPDQGDEAVLVLDAAGCREKLRSIARQGLGQTLVNSFHQGDRLHLRLECDGSQGVVFEMRVQVMSCLLVDANRPDDERTAPARYGATERYHPIDGRAMDLLNIILTGVTRDEPVARI